MGVTGLLGFVAPAFTDAHVSQFEGQYLAVDASCWLHRGCQGCASELAVGKLTTRFLAFSIKMVKMCRSHGVELLFVFDGAELPMKARTNMRREQQREAEMQRARGARELGRMEEAHACFKRAARVTPEMARQLITELQKLRVAFLVAPYEADPQLSFLVANGRCAAAISEDSDLLVYQCPCVLYKLEPNGFGRLISFESIRDVEDSGEHLFDGRGANEWQGWCDANFTDMAILAGCDYMQGFPGVGVKTAHALLREHGSLEASLSSVQAKRLDERVANFGSETTLEHFLNCANLVRDVFVSQRVYDPDTGHVVPFRPASACLAAPATTSEGVTRGSADDTANDEKWRECRWHCGPPISPSLAHLICVEASINPITLEAYSSPLLPTTLPAPVALPPFKTESRVHRDTRTEALQESCNRHANDELHGAAHKLTDGEPLPRAAGSSAAPPCDPITTPHTVTSRYFVAARIPSPFLQQNSSGMDAAPSSVPPPQLQELPPTINTTNCNPPKDASRSSNEPMHNDSLLTTHSQQDHTRADDAPHRRFCDSDDSRRQTVLPSCKGSHTSGTDGILKPKMLTWVDISALRQQQSATPDSHSPARSISSTAVATSKHFSSRFGPMASRLTPITNQFLDQFKVMHKRG